MNYSLLLQYVISSLINIPATLYVIFKFLKAKIDLKNPRLHITFWALVIIATLNAYYVSNYIRYIIMTIVIFVFNYFLFRKDFRTTLASTFAEQFTALLSEIIFAILLMIYMYLGGIHIIDNFVGNIIVNISISTIMVILINKRFLYVIYQKFLDVTNKIDVKILYLVVILLIVSANVLLFSGYTDLGSVKLFIINLCFMLIYFVIMYWALNERNLNIKYKEENNMLVENLNEYGKMLDQQRVANHENKNQLLVIRELARKKDKDIENYISEVLNTVQDENDKVLYTVNRIPSAGLQGLMYQKLCFMNEKNIDYNLNVSRDINKFPFHKLTSKINYDLFRAIGIILDNAIEESQKTEEKEIEISFYIDNGLVIEVSNYCATIPDLTQIDDAGYTTKGNGHGYGLALLREIVSENHYLKNEKSIIGNVFIQQIIVKNFK